MQAYQQAVAAKRRVTLLGGLVLICLMAAAGWMAELNPFKLVRRIGYFTDYFNQMAHLQDGPWVFSDPGEWFWGLKKWLLLLGDTLLMAYAGTLVGAIGAFCLCFLATKNLVRSAPLRFCIRRLLEFLRTVPDIVFALIFVWAFQLGPLPGVLAIMVHTTGALGKLFSEVVENIDMKPLHGIAASGGSWFHQIRFGVLPQVLSNFVSYALLRFEVNVRGATVLGFVGAGGIGMTLYEAIEKSYYSDISAILILIIVTVMVIDYATEILRHRLLG
ncbi:phosphonate ABC transporter, permease protein PhnE [Methylovirgula sp. 4M-Z18]|nr:phosphonate ABC transporter, permease protein PhnE [Methylovirgula sp. 4M-Z18]